MDIVRIKIVYDRLMKNLLFNEFMKEDNKAQIKELIYVLITPYALCEYNQIQIEYSYNLAFQNKEL